MLIAGTYEKAICGWELGKTRAVTPAFQVNPYARSRRSPSRTPEKACPHARLSTVRMP